PELRAERDQLRFKLIGLPFVPGGRSRDRPAWSTHNNRKELMATKRTGLGRGIGALIPTDSGSPDRPVDVFFPNARAAATEDSQELNAVPGARLASLNPNDIVPNAAQPRSLFVQEDLDELIHSIREFGVLQPIVVRPIENAKAG